MPPWRTQSDWVHEPASAAVVFAWAGAVGLLMSTQFLAQPFVWRNWAPDEILDGWLRIAGDRLVVAGAVAAFVVAANTAPWRGRQRLILLAIAVVSGAVVGELLRGWLDPFAARMDALAIAGRIVHWTLISAAGVGILACWRLREDYATTAARAKAADARVRRLLVASELDALQRQIEPHFLFNTLATIRRFGHTDPAEGLALLERLFRYVSRIFAASRNRDSTLGAELDLALAYLDVCQVRMGPRLRVRVDVPEDLRTWAFPPLMLGTLVENAMRHGLAPAPGGGTIELSASQAGGRLEVRVCDDGVGLTGEGGAGLGLANLIERLKLIYRDKASFRLEAARPHGVRAVIRISGLAAVHVPAR